MPKIVDYICIVSGVAESGRSATAKEMLCCRVVIGSLKYLSGLQTSPSVPVSAPWLTPAHSRLPPRAGEQGWVRTYLVDTTNVELEGMAAQCRVVAEQQRYRGELVSAKPRVSILALQWLTDGKLFSVHGSAGKRRSKGG